MTTLTQAASRQYAESGEHSSCPLCGASPLQVQGKGMHVAGHDRYEADGCCKSCGEHIGTIVAVMDTIFGIEEDERVLNGRCKVY